MSTPRGMLLAQDEEKRLPFLVYLTSGVEEDQVEQDVVDQTTLKDERVSLGSKMFTMVKADGNAIDENHPYHKWVGGRELPRILLFSGDGERIGKLEGRASPSKLYALLQKTANRDFKTDMDRFVKDYQKVLTELDKLDVQKQAVALKETRDISPAEQRKLERKKEEIAKEEEALLEAEKKLLEFERRGEA